MRVTCLIPCLVLFFAPLSPGPLHIRYTVDLVGAVAVKGTAAKDRIIYGGSCAKPPTPLHIWGDVVVAGFSVGFNPVLAGLADAGTPPPANTP